MRSSLLNDSDSLNKKEDYMDKQDRMNRGLQDNDYVQSAEIKSFAVEK